MREEVCTYWSAERGVLGRVTGKDVFESSRRGCLCEGEKRLLVRTWGMFVENAWGRSHKQILGKEKASSPALESCLRLHEEIPRKEDPK